jgi:homoserine O-acetyltransferase/O-succinyltransferase
MSDHGVLELGSVVLQCGITLPDVKVAYKTYGELNAARDNAVLMPSFNGGRHADTELMMAPGRVLDPAKLFTSCPTSYEARSSATAEPGLPLRPGQAGADAS